MNSVLSGIFHASPKRTHSAPRIEKTMSIFRTRDSETPMPQSTRFSWSDQEERAAAALRIASQEAAAAAARTLTSGSDVQFPLGSTVAVDSASGPGVGVVVGHDGDRVLVDTPLYLSPTFFYLDRLRLLGDVK